MKGYRTIRTAMKALWRNKMRAMLTTLGIVIGVAAVIATMEIGAGSSTLIEQSIASMGANVLMITPGAATSSGISFGAGSGVSLTAKDCAAIVEQCPSLRAAAPIVQSRTQVVYGGHNWVPSSMYGTTPAFLEVRQWEVIEGQPFTDRDVQSGSRVCLVGLTIVRELFEGESPIGREIRIKNVPFRVVGVLAGKGGNMMGQDQDDTIMTPYTSLRARISNASLGSVNQSSAAVSTGINTLSNLYPSQQPSLYPARSDVQAADYPMPIRFANVDRILAAAASPSEISSSVREISEVLRERHRLQAEEPDDFTVRDMTELANRFAESSNTIRVLLIIVASISLFVGGVGIMNIMLVSVTERIREIGLRMAVGARRRDILRQFLVEAVTLCAVGGGLGILLGHSLSYLVKVFMRWPTVASASAILASVGVSVTVGLVFGFYPAWKAARLDPIEALRYE